MADRICSMCRQRKPDSAFRNKTYLYCRPCQNRYYRNYRFANHKAESQCKSCGMVLPYLFFFRDLDGLLMLRCKSCWLRHEAKKGGPQAKLYVFAAWLYMLLIKRWERLYKIG